MTLLRPRANVGDAVKPVDRARLAESVITARMRKDGEWVCCSVAAAPSLEGLEGSVDEAWVGNARCLERTSVSEATTASKGSSP
jgi:hypothetical protein